MTRKTKTQWSFAKDRRLIQLAATLKSLEAVADEMKLTPKNVAHGEEVGYFAKVGSWAKG
jgi:hypothetical protein